MQVLGSRVEHSLMPVVARWAEQDKELLLPLFRLIATGEAVEEARLAKELNRETDAIRAALKSSLAEIDSRGRISELFGVTHAPTLHRIELGGVTLYSCCALVAHMVPAIMRQAVAIESTDPIDGSNIKLTISADAELQLVEPLTACASMIDSDLEEVIVSPRARFCCHVKHFAAAESANEFSSKKSARYIMAIEDFHRASRWLYERVWK